MGCTAAIEALQQANKELEFKMAERIAGGQRGNKGIDPKGLMPPQYKPVLDNPSLPLAGLVVQGALILGRDS